MVLVDGPTPGTPATLDTLKEWTSKYKVNYPSAIDPANKLSPIFDINAYPNNIVIDVRSMKIVKVITGVADNSFWSSFEQVLNKPGCLQ